MSDGKVLGRLVTVMPALDQHTQQLAHALKFDGRVDRTKLAKDLRNMAEHFIETAEMLEEQ